jgi:TPR repeat protein
LLILAGFGALLYYHWKGEGVSVSLAQLWNKVNPQSAAPAPPAAQPTPPPIAPDASPTDVAGQPHSATVTEQQPAQAAASNASPAQPAAAAPTPAPAPAAEAPKAETPQPESSGDNQEQPAEAAPSNPAPASAATAPEPSAGDSLAIEGERYLYGNGVPENCDRAQRSLTRAAQSGSTKAYTLLGAMYATGHCATRDLPTSYRWFARALHQDPSNTRLEKNLEVIWRQMTPEERQLATRQ